MKISYESYANFMRCFLNVAVAIFAFGFMLAICFLFCRLFAYNATAFGLFAARVTGVGFLSLLLVGIIAKVEQFIDIQK